MTVLSINYILNWVQIISGGRRYTCPTKEISGELFFAFKKDWHKVLDFTSEHTMELVSENEKTIYKKLIK
jgi:hypothetical protein